MVVRISLDGSGRAFYKNRYVRTEGFVKEQRAGKVLHRGVFGTLPADEEHLRGSKLKPEDVMKGGSPPKNVSNTALLHLPEQRRILSMWEAGLPYSLDPETLETFGIETLGGLLKPNAIFSAHPCLEESTRRLINFGVRPGMTPKVVTWEFDLSDSKFKLVQEHHLVLTDQGVIHDLCVTPRWIIVVHNPVSFNVSALMTKGSSVDELIDGESDENATTFIYVLPRDPSLLGGESGKVNKLFARYRFAKGFSYHHASAWEDAAGDIILDSVVYGQKPDLDVRSVSSRLSLNTTCGKGKLMRYRMPMPKFSGDFSDVKYVPTLLPGSPDSCEMPIVRSPCQGVESRFIYTVHQFCDKQRRPWGALMKSDTVTGALAEWRAPARCFIGEPCFVSRGASEDDGYVLVLMFDAAKQRSGLLAFDALDLGAGPVCKMWLRHHVPFSTHTMWTSESFGLPPSASL
eukprot:TRINITY_DN11818_c0_g1_i2.p1 TRINITY_DN11818_c0_g1~~TRINITY_DN11818_c0_g1_i2.p1  ORF type:complete len:537 (-),score=48.20 TRINITY_DN11818_c0_g1_i2:141-1517(-)